MRKNCSGGVKQRKHGVFTQKISIFLYRKALWGRHVSENAYFVDHVQLTISEEQRANMFLGIVSSKLWVMCKRLNGTQES